MSLNQEHLDVPASFRPSCGGVARYQATQVVTENPRDTEYRLFAQVTNALMRHQTPGDSRRVEALDWNRRLWLTLQSDASSDDNRLSDEIRARIISLAIWVDKHTRAVMRQNASVESLIRVNRTIMEGLAQR